MPLLPLHLNLLTMSYAVAIQTFIDALHAKAMPVAPSGVASTLRHFADASNGVMPPARGFWFESRTFELVQPVVGVAAGEYRLCRVSMMLSIAYPMTTDATDLDMLVHDDAIAVMQVFASVDTWSQATTGVLMVNDPAQRLYATKRIDDDEIAVLQFPLAVTYTETQA